MVLALKASSQNSSFHRPSEILCSRIEEEIMSILNECKSELEARLSSLTLQLSNEQRNSSILRSELELAHARDKASLDVLREFRKQLSNALVEIDNLKAENEWLRFNLSESRKMMQQNPSRTEEVADPRQLLSDCNQASKSPSNEDCSSTSSLSISGPSSQPSSQLTSWPSSWRGSNQPVSMGNLQDNSENTWHLEQQIISLTRDKKQLLTHLHWLSRQRPAHSRHETMPCPLESEAENLSLEEGSGARSDSLVAIGSESSSVLVRGKPVDFVDSTHIAGNSQHNSKKDNDDRLMEMLDGSIIEEQFTEKMTRLRTKILALKERVAKNNETCDNIFQLSFQNIRHPNEPRSYSLWSSCEEDHKFSLLKPKESLNHHNTSGISSLENSYDFQVTAPNECYSTLYKNKSFLSSPEFGFRGTPGLNKCVAYSSSFETASRDKPPLLRSQSDQQKTYTSLPGRYCEHMSLPRENHGQVLSRPTIADESENLNCNSFVSEIHSNPFHFNPLEHAVRQPETNCNEDISQRVLTATAFPTGQLVAENLIS